MIAPGRVFRNESVDASHEHTFYQLEGMMVDRDVSVAHLLYFMKTLLTAIFKREVTVRLRPGAPLRPAAIGTTATRKPSRAASAMRWGRSRTLRTSPARLISPSATTP